MKTILYLSPLPFWFFAGFVLGGYGVFEETVNIVVFIGGSIALSVLYWEILNSLYIRRDNINLRRENDHLRRTVIRLIQERRDGD